MNLRYSDKIIEKASAEDITHCFSQTPSGMTSISLNSESQRLTIEHHDSTLILRMVDGDQAFVSEPILFAKAEKVFQAMQREDATWRNDVFWVEDEKQKSVLKTTTAYVLFFLALTYALFRTNCG